MNWNIYLALYLGMGLLVEAAYPTMSEDFWRSHSPWEDGVCTLLCILVWPFLAISALRGLVGHDL